MKRGTIDHPKMRALVQALPVSGRYEAVGILESLWHFTALYAYRGDVGRHTDAAIAEWIGWRGSPDSLIDPLVKTGWLDRAAEPDRLMVHDWTEHCDDSVKKRLSRESKKPNACPPTGGDCPDMSGHVWPRARGEGLEANALDGEGDTGKPDLPHEWQPLMDPETMANYLRALTTADPEPAMLPAWKACMVELQSRNADPEAIMLALRRYKVAEPKFRAALPEARFLKSAWFLSLVTKYVTNYKRQVGED